MFKLSGYTQDPNGICAIGTITGGKIIAVAVTLHKDQMLVHYTAPTTNDPTNAMLPHSNVVQYSYADPMAMPQNSKQVQDHVNCVLNNTIGIPGPLCC